MSSALMQNYGTRELKFDHGNGSYLFTKEGERYLDFGMGIAVNSLGHCNPKLIDALTQQSKRLWHTSNLYNIAAGEELAAKLVAEMVASAVNAAILMKLITISLFLLWMLAQAAAWLECVQYTLRGLGLDVTDC